MDYGSFYGMGSYFGEDYTAANLVRLANLTQDNLAKAAAKLRPADIDASAGSVEEVSRIVGRIRQRWPKVRVLLRADSGFAREALMA